MIRAIAVIGALAALAACAGGPKAPSGPPQGAAYRQSVFLSGASLLFVQFDADRDYRTTRAEALAGAQAEWPNAAAGAQTLTPILFANWSAKALGGPNLGPYRLAFDTNVNNEITQAEFVAAILTKFDQFDTDKDGVLLRADMTERLPESPRGGPPGAGPGVGPPDGSQPPRRRPN